jgi:hypothetical protein
MSITNNSYPNCGYQNQIEDYGSCPPSVQNTINCGIPQLVLLDECGKITKIPANDGKILVGRAVPTNPNGQAEWKLETLPGVNPSLPGGNPLTASKGVKRVVDDFQLDPATILPNSIPATVLSGLANEALKQINGGTVPTTGVYNVTVGATGIPSLTTAVTGSTITPANVTAGSNKIILAGTPVGASLLPFSVDVDETKLTLGNLGGVLPVAKGGTGLSAIGTAGQFPVVNAAGTGMQWASPSAGGVVTLSGDVTGPSSTTTVAKIQGTNVSATAPTIGQVLAFNGTDLAFTTPIASISTITVANAPSTTAANLSKFQVDSVTGKQLFVDSASTITTLSPLFSKTIGFDTGTATNGSISPVFVGYDIVRVSSDYTKVVLEFVDFVATNDSANTITGSIVLELQDDSGATIATSPAIAYPAPGATSLTSVSVPVANRVRSNPAKFTAKVISGGNINLGINAEISGYAGK